MTHDEWLTGKYVAKKRLHVHATPLVVAVVGITSLLALWVQDDRGDMFAQSVLQPAIGAGVWLADTGRAQALVSDAPIERTPAGIDDKVSPDTTAAVDAAGASAKKGDVTVLVDAGRKLALQLALNGQTKRTR